MELKLTEEAKSDLRRMFNYYLEETQNEEYTFRIIQDIQRKIGDLRIFPLRYPSLNSEDETIRSMFYKNYAILYEVKKDMIIILGVKHSRMMK